MLDGPRENKKRSSRNLRGPLPSRRGGSCFDRLALVLLKKVDLKQSSDQTSPMCAEMSPPNLLIRFGGFDEANMIGCG